MSEKNQMKMTKRHKLLVIDDNERIVDILIRFLGKKYDLVTTC